MINPDLGLPDVFGASFGSLKSAKVFSNEGFEPLANQICIIKFGVNRPNLTDGQGAGLLEFSSDDSGYIGLGVFHVLSFKGAGDSAGK